MGERLTAANHYAMEVFKSRGKELKGLWESLVQMADDRATLFSLSVSFHDKQQQVSLTYNSLPSQSFRVVVMDSDFAIYV